MPAATATLYEGSMAALQVKDSSDNRFHLCELVAGTAHPRYSSNGMI